jgi:hypothetical protein
LPACKLAAKKTKNRALKTTRIIGGYWDTV